MPSPDGPSEELLYPFSVAQVAASAAQPGRILLVLENETGLKVPLDMPVEVALDLSWKALAIAKEAQETPGGRPNLHFPTISTLAQTMMGNNSGGHIVLHFITNQKLTISTELGPFAAALLSNQLNKSLSSMTVPPPEWEGFNHHAPLKGKSSASVTVTYFGQDYPRKVIEILGILIIRAGILEKSLIELLSAISASNTAVAETIFYSISNNKGRLDLISNMARRAPIGDSVRDEIVKLMLRIKKISNQRNILVHGDWEFKGDGFIVKERRAVPSNKGQSPIATFKSLSELASRYHDEVFAVQAMAATATRNIAKNTASAAPSGDPL